jgi:NAD(P)-dependent dehydrogenase (short-subunit alcohol dehydrogenase family)
MDKQQVVLITGTSSGFGRLAAETLARRGHRVFASMRDIHGKNAPARADIEGQARQENLSLEVVALDVTDDLSVASAVATVIARAARIDVVVNNAGVGCLGVNESFTPEQVRALFETNFFGADRVNRAALPHMRRQRSGLLVHVSSAAGRVVFPFLGPYCATKFALEALAESYRHDLADFGIDSVLVEPGVFGTDIGAHSPQPADRQRLEEYQAVQEKVLSVGRAFPSYLARPEAPRPQAVADALATLIALPAGARPLRTLVGPDARRMERLNQVAVETQADVLHWLGMAEGVPTSPGH